MKLENYLNSAISSLEHMRELLPKVIAKESVLGDESKDYPWQFAHGDWDCEGSPTKYCMYTNDWDSCIFCGQPDERK